MDEELDSLPRDCGVKILIDQENQRVIMIFEGLGEDEEPDPETPTGVEVTLSPELARDLAFTLTKASYAAEGDDFL